ncbi:Aste57867_1865 [Aphanomyces stellatus]|uniref:Aste57867_1865 protein n=1 Tax=Aphanomyces stellatus TaxID=120398 RepID=A0A485K7G0_9STRA|nr:hypothetical protein As57867_001863 [Aphanomyces stellatus]VFT79072.1 Aste57867_1865 [Aphanomyces stellatus]
MGCASSTEAAHAPQYRPTTPRRPTTPHYNPHAIYSPPRGLNQGYAVAPPTRQKESSVYAFAPQSLGMSHDDSNVDWSQYRALEPYKGTYWVDHDDLTVIRPIPCNYMKTQMGNLHGQPVLIKSLDLSKSTDEIAKSRKLLVSEITSMVRIDHPNIVKFVGFNLSPDRGLVCISEYLDNKTLRVLLDTPKLAAQLTWAAEKIRYAIDICAALAYMHNLKPTLIHRNVKASKVLLTDGRGHAKLSGFGVSRIRTFEDEMTGKIGDIEWSAPELLIDGEDYTEKVDVYSFGVLLTELDTCAMPFADEKAHMLGTDFTNRIATGALRPKLSSTCPPVIARVVRSCLQQDPLLRPSSDKVMEMLKQAKSQLNTSAVPY